MVFEVVLCHRPRLDDGNLGDEEMVTGVICVTAPNKDVAIAKAIVENYDELKDEIPTLNWAEVKVNVRPFP